MTRFPRKPYTGSCHCGHVRYIAYLSLPELPYPKTTPSEYREHSGHRIYKCNCTICHKAGILHLRLLNASEDFVVLSPSNPFAPGSGLKSYVPEGCQGAWHFCDKCGIRAFSLRGTGYNDEIELPSSLLQRSASRTLDGTAGEITAKDSQITRISVWRPKQDWQESQDEEGGPTDYLSVNCLSLDAHNRNLDLRQLYENGYMAYVQTLEWEGLDYQDTPYFGGTY